MAGGGTAKVEVSLVDVEPVRDLLVAGIRLYDALYHSPQALEFFTGDAVSKGVVNAYVEMQRALRQSPLKIVNERHEEAS